MINAGEVMEQNNDDDHCTCNQRALQITEPGSITQEITKCGAEAIGKQNCDPVKQFFLPGGDWIHFQIPVPPKPQQQCEEKAGDQQQRASGVAEMKRTIYKVGNFRSKRGSTNNHKPEQGR